MKKQTNIRLLIADSHELYLTGLKTLFSNYDEIEIVAQAQDGETLVEKVLQYKPHIVLTDTRLSKMDGLTATREIIKSLPDTRVIVLSQQTNNEQILKMLDAGIIGYLSKDTAQEEVVEGVRTVFAGKPYFCKEVTARLTEIVTQNYQLQPKVNATFTARELEIIGLICKEHTSKQIAILLSLSKRTVEGHRTRIMNKLGVRSIAGIITYAVENGLYDKD